MSAKTGGCFFFNLNLKNVRLDNKGVCAFIYLMAPLMKLDMTAMPMPLPDTMNISTNSRLRLKYCATISVEQSRVMPTPIPENNVQSN
jgi:hypothetical protein